MRGFPIFFIIIFRVIDGKCKIRVRDIDIVIFKRVIDISALFKFCENKIRRKERMNKENKNNFIMQMRRDAPNETIRTKQIKFKTK